MAAQVDILIPTFCRPAALAVTLAGLCAQTFRDFRVVVSDQTEDRDALNAGEVRAAMRVLRLHGHDIETHKHLPRRGVAEHRQFLLDRVCAPFALFLDDDLILETDAIGTLAHALVHEGCGFIGQAVIGPSFVHDVRPREQAIEFWDGPVTPETVSPDSPAWARHRLHNAANLYHVQCALSFARGEYRTYRVSWIGGCVLYDASKLRAAGGFNFWRELPLEHCGEDVLAQLRVMARFGGCGMIPSGVYHQELPTTVPDRRIDAPRVLSVAADGENRYGNH